MVERLLPEHDPEFQPTYGPWFTQAIGGDSRVWIVEGHRLREVSHRYGAMLRREMRIID